MIQIETLPDNGMRLAQSSSPHGLFWGCHFIACLVMAAVMMASIVAGIMLLLGTPVGLACLTSLLWGAAFAVRIAGRVKIEERENARILAETERVKSSAAKYGYVPGVRHLVTVSEIEAVWSVTGLDELGPGYEFGPGYIVRTAQNEYIYCAGHELGEIDCAASSLAETLTLETAYDLEYVWTASASGRRLSMSGAVPYRSVVADRKRDFAILDDAEIVRRLTPPVPSTVAT